MLSLLTLLMACGEKDENGTSDTGSVATEDTAVVDVCTESALGAFSSDVEWITLHGNSATLFSLAGEDALTSEYAGQYGTYDLNTVGFEGGNGFYLERPGRVLGAKVMWDNLSETESAAELYFWPDFGSNGYMWDADNPYSIESRCLTSDSNGQWIDYVLSEPIVIPQPLHVFAGYTRPERETGTPSTTPEIMMENYQTDGEPYMAGAWFLGVDDELYHRGMSSPWYTYQIQLAVEYDEEIPVESKPFQLSDIVSASSRVAWGDYDNDGDDDIMTNGPTLYANNGDGTFEDLTDALVFTTESSSGGVWGDYNNDGCLDYFGQGRADILLLNTCNANGEGYSFVDVTSESGIQDIQTERDCDGDGEAEVSPTEGSAWFDVDNDGWLDLYMANYECSSEYDYFMNYDDKVWRNNGDGTFTDWTANAKISQLNHAGRGVTTGDYDQDGDIDVFVSNYRLDPNFFYRNEGNGELKDIALINGTKGVAAAGAFGHTIGAVFGDVDNDGDLDMVHANLAHPFFYWFSDTSMVLINDGDGKFTNEGAERGLYYRETHSNPTLFDADNDGDLDLFITAVYSSRDSDFYLNDGTGHFTLANYESGLVKRNGWGSSVSDFDRDGDVDLIAYDLYENTATELGHWVTIRLFGGLQGGPADDWQEWTGSSNISAVGATVRVKTTRGEQMRHVSGGSGTGVQDSMNLHFGLGEADTIQSIDILFQGGTAVTIEDIDVDQQVWIHEDGSMEVGEVFPSHFLPMPEDAANTGDTTGETGDQTDTGENQGG